MSKERAIRRAARQAQSARAAAERARLRTRTERRDQLRSLVGTRLGFLRLRSRGASRGPLAAKRRRTVGLVVLGFLVVQALTWAATPDWGTRAAVILASLFALPVLAAFLR